MNLGNAKIVGLYQTLYAYLTGLFQGKAENSIEHTST